MLLYLASFSVFATDDDVSRMQANKIQAAILNAGYECYRVDHVQTESHWFSGTTTTVICDKVFRFILRYERGGISVEVE